MKTLISVSVCVALVFGMTSAAIAVDPVEGDLDGDFDVDAIDFALWQQAYDAGTADGDLDFDNDTDGDDFLVWQREFQPVIEASSGGGGLASLSSVPEPSSVALLSAGLLLLAGARRYRR